MNTIKLNNLFFFTIAIFLLYGCKNEDPGVEEFVFPSKVINRIMIDTQGVKWFATEQGVISYNGTNWSSYADPGKFSNGSIADLAYESAPGTTKIWLATNVGLSSFDLLDSPMSFTNYTTKETEISSDTVLALGIDQSNIKYVGTSKGLSILKENKWTTFYGRMGEEILSKYKINSVATAKNGWVYAATLGGGVSKFKFTDAVSGATTLSQPWANGLASDSVYSVLVDEDNFQWYGTTGGVAFHASEFTKSDWTSYSRADGLVCDTVYAIAKDQSGAIWFGTHRGVSRLTDTKWDTFTTQNGLVDNKVNAIAVDSDGSLWFGTDRGISHFASNIWENF
jgi:ligand-binding sensor domain-containing protein